MDDTFDLLPLRIDPQTKAITATSTSSMLEEELNILNATHRMLLTAETPNNIPPPPVPVNPKRSAAVGKMREQGNAAIQKRTAGGLTNIEEASKLYTYALEMALSRPPWEPSQLVRDEAAILFSNRAQAHIGMQNWPEGAVDAETSVELKPAPGQGKAWWRRGKCLLEMNRLDDAREWVARALEVETGDGAADLKQLKAQIDEKSAGKIKA